MLGKYNPEKSIFTYLNIFLEWLFGQYANKPQLTPPFAKELFLVLLSDLNVVQGIKHSLVRYKAN